MFSDCRAAREAWLATPRSTARFTSTVCPHGFGCLDWPHAGVSGGEARHPIPPSRPATKKPGPNNVRFAHQKPQTRRQGHPINSTIKQQEDQERHRDQCKANPRHRDNLTAPRDPPRYPFLCLCALCGFAHQKPQRPRQGHPINSTIKEHRDQDRQRALQQSNNEKTKRGTESTAHLGHPGRLAIVRDPLLWFCTSRDLEDHLGWACHPARPTNKNHRRHGTAHPGHPGKRKNRRSETLGVVGDR